MCMLTYTSNIGYFTGSQSLATMLREVRAGVPENISMLKDLVIKLCLMAIENKVPNP